MAKFIPYEKLSKKEKKRLDAAGRRDWGGMSPVTRRAENPRAYNRAKTRNWKKDQSASCVFYRSWKRARNCFVRSCRGAPMTVSGSPCSTI